MKGFLAFYNKHKKIIVLISIILLVILFILPLVTKRYMKINSSYTSKEDVALYVMQYHELPPNYITKDGLNYLKNHNMKYDNYIIGGDTHINTNELIDKGIRKDTALKECDVKGNVYDLKNNHRGSLRLVYTCNVKNVRVFYTIDHYENFVELSKFKLQLTSNIFWIIFSIYTVVFIGFYITIFIVKKKQ